MEPYNPLLGSLVNTPLYLLTREHYISLLGIQTPPYWRALQFLTGSLKSPHSQAAEAEQEMKESGVDAAIFVQCLNR